MHENVDEWLPALSASQSASNLIKLRVVRRRKSLGGAAYETTSTMYTSRPEIERPAREFLKGSCMASSPLDTHS